MFLNVVRFEQRGSDCGLVRTERFSVSSPQCPVGDVIMCHHYDHETASWWSDRTEDEDPVDAADDDWMTEDFEAERDVEVELVTDGGDGDDA